MLLDRSFTIVTDHLFLVHGFQKPSPSHSLRQSRQLSYLTEFNCTFEHIAGEKNCTADCRSRLMVHNIFAQGSLSITLLDFSKEQQHCMATNPDLFRFPNDSINCKCAVGRFGTRPQKLQSAGGCRAQSTTKLYPTEG